MRGEWGQSGHASEVNYNHFVTATAAKLICVVHGAAPEVLYGRKKAAWGAQRRQTQSLGLNQINELCFTDEVA